jgi:hypothetical protein
MFYVLHSKPKLDYTYYIEISVLFSKIESHDVPYLSRILVRDTLSSCIVDRWLEGIPWLICRAAKSCAARCRGRW